jgi:NAD(P)-dependent dehydrogenase (short-subunit alcohol dehydrogenase family)
MQIEGRVALITGAASGIGAAVAAELAHRGARALALVDRSDHVTEVARAINAEVGRPVAESFLGDASSAAFRSQTYDKVETKHGVVHICVPAAGITRDSLAVKIDKATGKAVVYPVETFRAVLEVNLIAPVYWALEMVARIAEDRCRRGLGRWEPQQTVQGTVVLIGSVSSQGNKGQIAYAVSKAGLEGAAATLMKEAIFHGVRCAVIHPGYTDTPMVRALGEEFIAKNILPYTQLRRLIRPAEIADAICFLIANSAVSGELWADAGWHPSA